MEKLLVGSEKPQNDFTGMLPAARKRDSINSLIIVESSFIRRPRLAVTVSACQP